MSRLFTFGCSFTSYSYPTWADIVGTQFDYYENWGKPGAGNFYIASQLIECNQINKINKNDVVLIMLSSFSRFDIINKESEFLTCGNIYSQKGCFDDKFIEKYWSDEYGIYMTWFAINSIINLLEKTECKYKILTGFDLYKVEYDLFTSESLNKLRIKNCSEYFNTVLPKHDLFTYTNEKIKKGIKYYTFKETGLDDHPTITIHHDWVKEYLPEYYDESMKLQCEKWEELIEDSRYETWKNFESTLKGNHKNFSNNFNKMTDNKFFLYNAHDTSNGNFDIIIEDIKKFNPETVFFWSAGEHEMPCNIDYVQYKKLEKTLIDFNVQFYIMFGSCYNEKNKLKYPYQNFQFIYWPTFYLHVSNYGLRANYGDINDIKIENKFEHLYQCFNNNPHNHRCFFMDELNRHDLIKDGLVSWNTLSTEEGYAKYNFKFWKEDYIEIDDYKKNNRNEFSNQLLHLKSFINIASESTESSLFITEKTFRPLLTEQCVICLASTNQNNVLQDFGFKLYDELFDYSFDGEKELHLRIGGLINILYDLKDIDMNELYNKVKDKVIFNKNRALEIIENDPYIPIEFINFYNQNIDAFNNAMKNDKLPQYLKTILKNK